MQPISYVYVGICVKISTLCFRNQLEDQQSPLVKYLRIAGKGKARIKFWWYFNIINGNIFISDLECDIEQGKKEYDS